MITKLLLVLVVMIGIAIYAQAAYIKSESNTIS